MRSKIVHVLAAVLLAAAAQAAPPSVLPFAEVRAGMKGTGKTVFQAGRVESFDVEILGTLPNIGPDQNLILARLSGGPLAETGVIAGMSGSPVFVDGKLVGAVAYSWGFAKEAIAGITPIEEMLAAGRREDRPSDRRRASAPPGPASLEALRAPERAAAFVESALGGRLRRASGSLPLPLPLAVAGIGDAGIARIGGSLEAAGFALTQSGSPSAPGPERPFEPGSAVGVKLVRGDVDMTATGTVTWVDGDRVYAFGHPLFGLGNIDLPLTGARVEALLPSLEHSVKFAVPLAESGAFRQDRASAIVGRTGAKARMIPVRLQLADGGGVRKTYAFDVADDPLLSPLLLYSAVNGVLANVERTFGSLTLRMKPGSAIQIEGADSVELDNVFSGPSASSFATGLSAYVLYLLMNNEWSSPRVTGVNLILDYEPEPRTATIRRVGVDRVRVRAGESVTASIFLVPYRGTESVLTRSIRIPPETPPGRLLLQIGDASSVSRAESPDDPLFPRDLDQLIRLINRLRRNDRVYVVGSRPDTGVFIAGARLTNLPPSVAGILSRPRTQGNFATLTQRGVLEDEIPTEYAVDGFARLQLEVEAP